MRKKKKSKVSEEDIQLITGFSFILLIIGILSGWKAFLIMLAVIVLMAVSGWVAINIVRLASGRSV